MSTRSRSRSRSRRRSSEPTIVAIAAPIASSESASSPPLFLNTDGTLSTSSSTSTPPPPSSTTTITNRIRTALAAAFLPAGYPSSVPPDYLPFQLWDTIQALCSYVRGMLSTQSMLQGIGVGSSTATPAAAMLQFFARDAAGLLVGIIFTAVEGSSFDAYAKQWRLAADVANDVGLSLELVAPAFPSLFLVLACTASICRTVTGVAGGATRMALTQHFAKQMNGADIAAKEGSQETAVTLVGMVVGLGLTRLAAVHVASAWGAFVLLTILHVYANIKAMRSLCISRLNAERLAIIVEACCRFGGSRVILTTQEVAMRERLLPPLYIPARVREWGMPSTSASSSTVAVPRTSHRQHYRILLSPSLESMDRESRQLIARHFESDVATWQWYEREGRFSIVVDDAKKAVYVLMGAETRDGDGRDAVEAYCIAREHLVLGGGGNYSDARKRDGSWVALLEQGGWNCERPALMQRGGGWMEWRRTHVGIEGVKKKHA